MRFSQYKKVALSVALISTIPIVMTGCNSGGSEQTPGPTNSGSQNEKVSQYFSDSSKKTSLTHIKLTELESCDATAEKISENILANELIYSPVLFQAYQRTDVDGDVLVTPHGAVSRDAATENLAADDQITVSKTNTQEAEVDESDIIKTAEDGTLFIAKGRKLLVVKGYPADEISESAELDLDSYIQGLYLDDENDLVLALGHASTSGDHYLDYVTTSKLFIIDVSDRTQPEVVKEMDIDGYTIASRLVEERVQVVSQHNFKLPRSLFSNEDYRDLLEEYHNHRVYYEYDDDGVENTTDSRNLKTTYIPEPNGHLSEEERKALANAIYDMILEAVEESDMAELLPAVRSYDGDGNLMSTDVVSCDAIYSPEIAFSPSLATITSFDTDGEEIDMVSLFSNAQNVYSSKDKLYIVQTSEHWMWHHEQEQQSAIYQFSLEEDSTVYEGAGLVDGHIHSSFWLSEQNGFLRAVTTERPFFAFTDENSDIAPPQPHQNLFVLKMDDSNTLEVISKIEEFGKNESIFSVRYIEDRAYVVTFRIIDPLFVFDLSDPYSPALASELKIPGFSTYIHPLENNHLLTLGQEDSEVQFQIFDVTDINEPRLAHKTVLERTYYAGATYNHHAFAYNDEKGILTVPVMSYGSSAIQGMAVMDIDINDGITEKGRIDHSVFAEASSKPCYNALDVDNITFDICLYDGGWVEPLRTVYISDDEETYLYTLSQGGILVSPFSDLEEQAGKLTF